MAVSGLHLFPDSFSYSEFAQFISRFKVVSAEAYAGPLLCSKCLRLMLLRPFLKLGHLFLLIVGSKSRKLFRKTMKASSSTTLFGGAWKALMSDNRLWLWVFVEHLFYPERHSVKNIASTSKCFIRKRKRERRWGTLLWVECEMSPTGSCVWMVGPSRWCDSGRF